MGNISISKNSLDISDVTAIVSTHERSFALNNLVDSFHLHYPDLKIIAVDSSKNPQIRTDISHVLSSDLWISQQRNMALHNVHTALLLLLDDDFLCSEKTDIIKLIDSVVNSDNQIVGGVVDNIWSEQYDFHGYYDIIWNTLYHFVWKKNPTSYNYETIFNFFVWETNAIKWIGWWDDNLKYAREHDDFFLRAKHKDVKVSYNHDVAIEHHHYRKHHWGTKSLWCVDHFLLKRNIDNKVEVRFIDRGSSLPYISYHNCIASWKKIEKHMEEKIKSLYWDFPIIIS